MSRTHFQDFTKDDGTPVTVEYEVDGHYSPTTYSPHSGADGGDAPTFSIIKSWLNTPEHDAICKELRYLEVDSLQGVSIRTLISISGDEDRKERIHELRRAIEEDDKKAYLTCAERERMEAWIAEQYVEDEPDIEF